MAKMKVLLIDMDDGAISLGSPPPANIQVVQFFDAPPVPVEMEKQVKDQHAYILGRSRLLKELLNPTVDVVVLDSLTALSTAVLREIAQNKNNDYYKPEIQDWGTYSSDMACIFNMLTNPRLHVIFIAHEDVVMKSEGIGKERVDKVRPMIHTRLVSQVPNYFDEVYQATNRGTETMWRAQGNAITTAKSRLGMPTEIKADWGPVFTELTAKFGTTRKLRALLYGESGTRKTRSVLSIP